MLIVSSYIDWRRYDHLSGNRFGRRGSPVGIEFRCAERRRRRTGQSFPFYCDLVLPLDEPWNLDLAETTYGVDTREWRDAMGPDD